MSSSVLPVRGFRVARGHRRFISSSAGSSPASCLTRIITRAQCFFFDGVKKGSGPRLLPECLPGNQSGSLSTRSKSSCRDWRAGCEPSFLTARAATHGALTLPPWISRLASLSANARACSHGHMRLDCPPRHNSRSASWLGAMCDKWRPVETGVGTSSSRAVMVPHSRNCMLCRA